MAFSKREPKQISKWVDYEVDGVKQGRLSIRGSENHEYQVEIDRISNTYARGKHIEHNGIPLTHNHAVFLAVANLLIVDWDGIAFEEDGVVTEVPFTPEDAFNLMRWGAGLSGGAFAGFVLGQSHIIQNEADAYKVEVLGKSENSTTGVSTVTKPAKSRKNKPTSTNG